MKKVLNVLIALTGWFAVIAQFFLMLENRSTSVPEMVLRFFSFFTILTNTLVAIYFTWQSLAAGKSSDSWFSRPGSLTAVTVYILVVGLVYQVALRHVWHPTGLQKVVDELLHSVIPLLVVVYWACYEQRQAIPWKKIPGYLLYPALYLVYILLRGQLSGFYPYPFIHVTELGWPGVLVNSAVLLGVFVLLFVLFIAIGRLLSKKARLK